MSVWISPSESAAWVRFGFAIEDVGMPEPDLEFRRARERTSLQRIEFLREHIRTLPGLHEFLFLEHDAYSAAGLLKPRARDDRLERVIGVPVLAKGKWSNPQIYADLPDILSNPAAALGKLRAGDKGLPGMLGGGGAENWMKRLDEMIGGREGGGLGERLKQFQIPR